MSVVERVPPSFRVLLSFYPSFHRLTMVRGEAEPVALTCVRISANAAYASHSLLPSQRSSGSGGRIFLLPVATRCTW